MSPNTVFARRSVQTSANAFEDFGSFALASLSKIAHLGPLIRKRPTLPITNTWVPLCGVHHRQHEGRCAITPFFQDARMPDLDSDRRRDLECLRLASELIELATATLNPALKAHCLRMAGVWTNRVRPERDK